jgi:hypothetical protein
VKIKPQWVVTPGKQQKHVLINFAFVGHQKKNLIFIEMHGATTKI